MKNFYERELECKTLFYLHKPVPYYYSLKVSSVNSRTSSCTFFVQFHGGKIYVVAPPNETLNLSKVQKICIPPMTPQLKDVSDSSLLFSSLLLF